MNGDNELNCHLIIQTEATDSIWEAYLWYENKAQGLGAEFARTLDANLASIERTTTAYPVVHK